MVLATGALERPFVFPGNDAPGVMLAGAALAYARRYGVAVGNDVVVFTNNDGGWRTRVALARAGVAGPRRRRSARRGARGRRWRSWPRPARNASPGHVVTATTGGTALASSRSRLSMRRAGKVSGAPRELKCDALAVSAGWSPLIHLASQAGGPPAYDEAIHAFVPGEPREKLDRRRRRSAARSTRTRPRPKARSAGADAAQAPADSTPSQAGHGPAKRAPPRRTTSCRSSRSRPRARPSSTCRTT